VSDVKKIDQELKSQIQEALTGQEEISMSVNAAIWILVILAAATEIAVAIHQHRAHQQHQRGQQMQARLARLCPKPPNWDSPTATKQLYQLAPAPQWDGRTVRYLAEFGPGTGPADAPKPMTDWAVTEYILTHFPLGRYRLYLTENGVELDAKELTIPERTAKA